MRADLDARLRAARASGFVGREAERELFLAALRGDVPAAVIWVCGPGGIGKSALLERFADDARAADRPVLRLDGRQVGASPLELAPRQPATVVLIDSFERFGDIEDRFRRDVLPGLPASTVVVVASWHAPSAGWRADLAWSELLRVIALRNLPHADAWALLDTRKVPAGVRERLLAFAGGHPLALALAAHLATTGTATARDWVPGPDVIRTLLSELVGALPSPAHRHVLEVCAHAYETTEELLRRVIPDADADALFDWLRTQPFVEPGPDGVFPHDIVREVLDADLRWRDPRGYQAMHRAIRGYLLERARTAEGTTNSRTLAALSYLHRHGGVMADYITFQRRNDVYEDGFRPGDRAAVLAMATRTEGAASARIVDFWLSRQPAAFRVFRRAGTDEPVGFMAWLRLTESVNEEAESDPVVAAAWHHSRSAAPLRAGEHIALARFMVDPSSYQQPSPVTDLVQMRILSEWLRAARLAWSYIVVADPARWERQMEYLDQRLTSGAATVGDRSYRLYGHDWRAVPAEPWLDRHITQELFGPRPRPAVTSADLLVLSREEFDTAVRDVLSSWLRTDRLAASPLTRSALILGAGDDPVAALKQAVSQAVDVLARDPKTEHLQRAVATTYFRGVPSQEAAAERLGLPLSTFRRHLSRGVEQTCDLLWARELYGIATL